MSDRAARLAGAAVGALLEELELFPKPGLVSPIDSGSHRDMDHALLTVSAETLRGPFQELALAADAPFHDLAEIGRRAELQMLRATGGVNTHRGAIFSLGLLVAATAGTPENDPQRIRNTLLARWGPDLAKHAEAEGASHGADVRRRTGAGGARTEAALGFPSIFDHALPHLRCRLSERIPPRPAGLETLFLLIAHVEDTNVIHRGGTVGGEFSRLRARDFLEAGGVLNPHWERFSLQIHREFVERNLSPGGAADLLAATFFLRRVTAASDAMHAAPQTAPTSDPSNHRPCA